VPSRAVVLDEVGTLVPWLTAQDHSCKPLSVWALIEQLLPSSVRELLMKNQIKAAVADEVEGRRDVTTYTAREIMW
jgi:hypothetical protein